MKTIITAPELQKLIAGVHGAISEQPTDFMRLDSSLENLLYLLTTPAGRTKENCEETDLYFCLHKDNNLN